MMTSDEQTMPSIEEKSFYHLVAEAHDSILPGPWRVKERRHTITQWQRQLKKVDEESPASKAEKGLLPKPVQLRFLWTENRAIHRIIWAIFTCIVLLVIGINVAGGLFPPSYIQVFSLNATAPRLRLVVPGCDVTWTPRFNGVRGLKNTGEEPAENKWWGGVNMMFAEAKALNTIALRRDTTSSVLYEDDTDPKVGFDISTNTLTLKRKMGNTVLKGSDWYKAKADCSLNANWNGHIDVVVQPVTAQDPVFPAKARIFASGWFKANVPTREVTITSKYSKMPVLVDMHNIELASMSVITTAGRVQLTNSTVTSLGVSVGVGYVDISTSSAVKATLSNNNQTCLSAGTITSTGQNTWLLASKKGVASAPQTYKVSVSTGDAAINVWSEETSDSQYAFQLYDDVVSRDLAFNKDDLKTVKNFTDMVEELDNDIVQVTVAGTGYLPMSYMGTRNGGFVLPMRQGWTNFALARSVHLVNAPYSWLVGSLQFLYPLQKYTDVTMKTGFCPSFHRASQSCDCTSADSVCSCKSSYKDTFSRNLTEVGNFYDDMSATDCDTYELVDGQVYGKLREALDQKEPLNTIWATYSGMNYALCAMHYAKETEVVSFTILLREWTYQRNVLILVIPIVIVALAAALAIQTLGTAFAREIAKYKLSMIISDEMVMLYIRDAMLVADARKSQMLAKAKATLKEDTSTDTPEDTFEDTPKDTLDITFTSGQLKDAGDDSSTNILDRPKLNWRFWKFSASRLPIRVVDMGQYSWTVRLDAFSRAYMTSTIATSGDVQKHEKLDCRTEEVLSRLYDIHTFVNFFYLPDILTEPLKSSSNSFARSIPQSLYETTQHTKENEVNVLFLQSLLQIMVPLGVYTSGIAYFGSYSEVTYNIAHRNQLYSITGFLLFVTLCGCMYNAVALIGCIWHSLLRTGYEIQNNCYGKPVTGKRNTVKLFFRSVALWYFFLCDFLSIVGVVYLVGYFLYAGLFILLGVLVYPARIVPYATAVVGVVANIVAIKTKLQQYYEGLINDLKVEIEGIMDELSSVIKTLTFMQKLLDVYTKLAPIYENVPSHTSSVDKASPKDFNFISRIEELVERRAKEAYGGAAAMQDEFMSRGSALAEQVQEAATAQASEIAGQLQAQVQGQATSFLPPMSTGTDGLVIPSRAALKAKNMHFARRLELFSENGLKSLEASVKKLGDENPAYFKTLKNGADIVAHQANLDQAVLSQLHAASEEIFMKLATEAVTQLDALADMLASQLGMDSTELQNIVLKTAKGASGWARNLAEAGVISRDDIKLLLDREGVTQAMIIMVIVMSTVILCLLIGFIIFGLLLFTGGVSDVGNLVASAMIAVTSLGASKKGTDQTGEDQSGTKQLIAKVVNFFKHEILNQSEGSDFTFSATESAIEVLSRAELKMATDKEKPDASDESSSQDEDAPTSIETKGSAAVNATSNFDIETQDSAGVNATSNFEVETQGEANATLLSGASTADAM